MKWNKEELKRKKGKKVSRWILTQDWPQNFKLMKWTQTKTESLWMTYVINKCKNTETLLTKIKTLDKE